MSITVTVKRPDLFPSGTTVKAYLRSKQFGEKVPLEGEPKGSSQGEGTAGTEKVEVAGLAEATNYILAGEVSSVWKYISTRTEGFVGATTPTPVPPLVGSSSVAVSDTSRGVYSGIRVPGGAVSLRFDDSRATDFSETFPELKSRFLPFGLGTIKQALDKGDGGNGTYLTRAHLTEMQECGAEIMLHAEGDINKGELVGHETLPPRVAFEALLNEDLTNLREGGYNVDSFVQPGEWTGIWNFTTAANWEGVASLVREKLSAAEAYLENPNVTFNAAVALPFLKPYGQTYIGGDEATLGQLEGYVNECIQYGAGAEFVFHSAQIGQAGQISLANFVSFLGYLKTKREQGVLDVLTPTALRYAVHGERINLLQRGGFEQYAAGAIHNQTEPDIWKIEGGTGATVNATTAHTGTKSMECESGNASAQLLRGDGLRTVLFEGFVRDTEAGPHEARIILRGQNKAGTQVQNRDVGPTGITNAGWTQILVPTSVKNTVRTFKVWPFTHAGKLLWDDCALYKI